MLGLSISLEVDENGVPHVVVNDSISARTVRSDKGKSLIGFPSNYTVIDTETTGLSPEWDEIIELSAVRFENGIEVDSFSTLVKPKNEVDEYITDLTGITNEMLEGAPSISDCIDEFASFLGNEVLVGYNVNFDINFIYDNMMSCLKRPLKNDFIDVMRIAKRELPELEHHRQTDIVQFFGIHTDREHRALHDCRTCNQCFEALKEHIIARGLTLDEFETLVRKSHSGVRAGNITAQTTEFDEEHPLYGKVCVFTGTLEKMTRAEAMQLVANLGGVPADGVNKKTNYLILGNNDYCKTIKDGKSSKQKKAEELILKGTDLQIIPECVFYDML